MLVFPFSLGVPKLNNNSVYMGEAYRVSISKISSAKYLLITDSLLPPRISFAACAATCEMLFARLQCIVHSD